MAVSGTLVTRQYKGFRGIDLRGGEVNLNRSPDALNVWRDYSKSEGISTRPELELVDTYDNVVYGLFFYKVGNTEMMIVHSGTKLYRVIDGVKEEIFTGMKPARSHVFVYNNMLYIKDGINYLKYDGETCSQVVGFIPTTSIGRKPSGGGTTYQDVNMLSAWRKNTFLADGESTVYHLDAKDIDGEAPIVVVNGTQLTVLADFDYDPANGTITFKNAPSEPLTEGQDNVEITFKKTVTGHADRINKCTLLAVFDNRVFFSGNVDYPNVVWHSSLNDPSYCSDLDYYNEGLDLAPVKSMVAGNNALWVFKEPSQANTTVFYHNPVVDAEYGKIYPSSHSSISTGCIATGINFNDDICFFSERGMEAIGGDVTTEQVLAHRSSLVDSKLLSEANYKGMILEEWEGYLLVIIGSKVYLADSRQMFQNGNHNEYEWFYWELEKNITCTRVKDGVLYLCTADGIYKVGHEEGDYTEVTFAEENGEYVLYGESTQTSEPTPDTPVEIVNTYKAGIKYRATINGREYRFMLHEDLRSVGDVKDKVYLSDGKLYVEKNIKIATLNGSENWVYDAQGSAEDSTVYGAKVQIGDYAGNTKFATDYGNNVNLRSNMFQILPSYEESIECMNGGWGNYIFVKLFSSRLSEMSIGGVKAYFADNNTEIYYELVTPTTNEICFTTSPTSYWATPSDKFNYANYQKTTNKRGCVVEALGEVTVYVKTDKTDWELIGRYTDITDYFVSRIKRKKFKDIQLKFHSLSRFNLESATLECYIGGYIKR